MRDLRRHLATGGSYVPHPGWQIPWWWAVAQSARYWHVHPADVMNLPSSWVDIAAACMDIEAHCREVQSMRSR